MRVEVLSSELGSALCQVTVCIGCNRRATGVRRAKMSTARSSTAAGGGGDEVAGLVALIAAFAGIFGWATSVKTVVAYPTCWRHRWIIPPPLKLESTDGERAVLDGVSAEFHTEWEATRATGGRDSAS